MSISYVGAASNWVTSRVSSPVVARTSASSAAGAMVANENLDSGLQPRDPRIKDLTDTDRAMIKSTTGVDIKADGHMMVPMSMSMNAVGAVKLAAAQLADQRAGGMTTNVSTDSFTALVAEYARQLGGTGTNRKPHIDALA